MYDISERNKKVKEHRSVLPYSSISEQHETPIRLLWQSMEWLKTHYLGDTF